jgi:hypothetical protein
MMDQEATVLVYAPQSREILWRNHHDQCSAFLDVGFKLNCDMELGCGTGLVDTTAIDPESP